jgi:hypothetical protein
MKKTITPELNQTKKQNKKIKKTVTLAPGALVLSADSCSGPPRAGIEPGKN